MELLYRQRAIFDCANSWKWLGESERWGYLAYKETASRFKKIGPMAMGPNTVDGDKRGVVTLRRMHNSPAQVT